MGKTDIQKMFAELDELYNVNNTDGVVECMNRWLRETCSRKDWHHELTILKELIGFYRKSGDCKKGMEMISLQGWWDKDRNAWDLMMKFPGIMTGDLPSAYGCRKRNDQVAVVLSLSEFMKAACSMIHLLNRHYMPFYKW